jgi:putative autotransporter adhesin-like protein
MKTSTRVLLFTGLGFWVVLTIFVLIAARYVSLDKHEADAAHTDYTGHDHNNETLVALDAGTGPFDRIETIGAWDIRIHHSPTSTVSIETTEGNAKHTTVTRENGTLKLAAEKGDLANGLVVIGVPDLSLIQLKGMSNVKLEHLSLDELTILAEGMTNIETSNVLIKRLTYRGKGACNVDFSDQGVTDAEVAAEGMGQISLTMRGGSLSGSLKGLMNLDYDGEVSSNTLKTEGLASIGK